MKIAMIGHKNVNTRSGGVEVVVEELGSRMAMLGHEVTTYDRYEIDEKPEEKIHSYKGMHVKNIPTLKSGKFNALIYSFFATINAVTKNYDIIHYHAEGPSVMIGLAKLFGKKVVTTNHGLDWKRAKWGGFATKYLKYGEKVQAAKSDELIVLSEPLKDYFEDTYHVEPIEIPNGVNEFPCVPADSITKKWGLKKDNYILFLARLVPEKGLHYLIDAYQKIHTDKKLVIAGGSSHTDDYTAAIKEKVKDNPNIIMTGFVSGKEYNELFSNAYLYVLPSDVEGMPLSLMEAMSFGNAVLVSDIAENVKVGDAFAVFFEHGNVADLTEKLFLLLTHPDVVREYKSLTTDYILKNYSWDEITKQTLAVYEKVLGEDKK
jgi:glycosyltransferase involved in cell wall biosynthesis